jgi:uncharacterized protein HemX
MTLKACLAAIAVALILGAAGGYRYAQGRCAVAQLDATKDVLETSRTRLVKAQTADNQAAKREATTVDRQTKERVRYGQIIKESPVVVDCRIPDDAHRLLVDAVRAANTAAARAD